MNYMILTEILQKTPFLNMLIDCYTSKGKIILKDSKLSENFEVL